MLVLEFTITQCSEKICHFGLSKILGVLDGVNRAITGSTGGMVHVELIKWQPHLLLFEKKDRIRDQILIEGLNFIGLYDVEIYLVATTILPIFSSVENIYRTRAIITRGLYTFYPLF